jgi:hypothetical protein
MGHVRRGKFGTVGIFHNACRPPRWRLLSILPTTPLVDWNRHNVCPF